MAVIKQSLRWVRLGKFATKFATSMGDENLINLINSLPYPIMVEEQPAVLPVPFNQLGRKVTRQPDQADSNSPKDERSTISKYLESIYSLPDYEPPDGGEKGGEKGGEIFPQSEKGGEKISPSDDGGEKPKTQAEQDFFTPGEKSHLFPRPDHDPSDGCIRGGDWESEKDFTLDEASQVLRLKKKGKGKTEIIKTLGYSSGKAYKKGKAKYDKIEAYWEAQELW